MDIVVPPTVFGANTLPESLRDMGSVCISASLEVFPDPPYFDIWSVEQVHRVAAALDETAIRIYAIHVPFGDAVDLSSASREAVENGLGHAERVIELCQQFEARFAVIHPGHILGEGADESARYRQAARSLKALAPRAAGAGVVLAVENLPPNHVGSAFDRVVDLVAEVGSAAVGVCLDTGHANLYSPPQRPCAAAEHLVWIHAHDNHGQTDEHLMPGLGTVDWSQFRADLDAIGFANPIMLECRPAEDMTVQGMIDRFFELTGYEPS